MMSEAAEVVRFFYAIGGQLGWGPVEAEASLTHLLRAVFAGTPRCPSWARQHVRIPLRFRLKSCQVRGSAPDNGGSYG